jgi:hypothetical protein
MNLGANIIYSTLIFKKTAESTVSEFSEETAKNQSQRPHCARRSLGTLKR